MATISIVNTSNHAIKISAATAVTDYDGHGDLSIQQRRSLPVGDPVVLPAGEPVSVDEVWFQQWQAQNISSPLTGVVVPVS